MACNHVVNVAWCNRLWHRKKVVFLKWRPNLNKMLLQGVSPRQAVVFCFSFWVGNWCSTVILVSIKGINYCPCPGLVLITAPVQVSLRPFNNWGWKKGGSDLSMKSAFGLGCWAAKPLQNLLCKYLKNSIYYYSLELAWLHAELMTLYITNSVEGGNGKRESVAG